MIPFISEPHILLPQRAEQRQMKWDQLTRKCIKRLVLLPEIVRFYLGRAKETKCSHSLLSFNARRMKLILTHTLAPSLSPRHFIWLWVLCNLRQHDWCSTFMRGILTAPLQRSVHTQLCVWASNLEFMLPWQQIKKTERKKWSCIMDYHWNSTPQPNIMRARDLIKSAILGDTSWRTGFHCWGA